MQRLRSKFTQGIALLGLGLAGWAVPQAALSADACEAEANWKAGEAQHFMVLAGQSGVFYDRSGPAFVMLIKSTDRQADIGALGIYADEAKQPRFGAIPASTYEGFLREPGAAADVMLRLEINGPQYDRALAILESWNRRVRDGQLLYPEIALDNILMVKQATEELNRCRETITPYDLDWGVEDAISEYNIPRRVPLEYFRTLRRLNEELHVTDGDMPVTLLSLAEVPANSTPTDRN